MATKRGGTARIYIDKKELLWMYKAGATQGEMAKYFGCGRGTISNRLREMGIYMAESGENAPSWKGGVRKRSSGRYKVYEPKHALRDADGYVSMAVIVWERFAKLPFPEGMVPHHRNGDKLDDRPYNILPVTPKEHSRLGALLKKDPGAAAKFERNLLKRMRMYIATGKME
jgi:hypothetical protein